MIQPLKRPNFLENDFLSEKNLEKIEKIFQKRPAIKNVQNFWPKFVGVENTVFFFVTWEWSF